MTIDAILHPTTVLGSFVLLFSGGMLLYFALSSLSYLYFYVLRKERYFPNETPSPVQMRTERKWAVLSLLGNAVLTAPLHMYISTGRSKLYWDVGQHGYGYLLLSAMLYLFITETAIYWIHRWLHTPWLYRHVHLQHHLFRKPTPWAGVAFHPLDSFSQAFPHHLCVFLFPVHGGVYFGFLTFVTVWAVMIHDRVTFVSSPAILYTKHHTVHHKFNKFNYGQFLTFWDRLGGTYRHPDGLVYDGNDAVRAPLPVTAELAGDGE